jgi:hypothetical protein
MHGAVTMCGCKCKTQKRFIPVGTVMYRLACGRKQLQEILTKRVKRGAVPTHHPAAPDGWFSPMALFSIPSYSA